MPLNLLLARPPKSHHGALHLTGRIADHGIAWCAAAADRGLARVHEQRRRGNWYWYRSSRAITSGWQSQSPRRCPRRGRSRSGRHRRAWCAPFPPRGSGAPANDLHDAIAGVLSPVDPSTRNNRHPSRSPPATHYSIHRFAASKQRRFLAQAPACPPARAVCPDEGGHDGEGWTPKTLLGELTSPWKIHVSPNKRHGCSRSRDAPALARHRGVEC